MDVIVDRFEGKYAVCEKEDKTMINIEKLKLPVGVKEGDVLIIKSSGISINLKATLDRKIGIKKMMKDIWN